jgi:GMP synthase-like glutamine amidotransferase
MIRFVALQHTYSEFFGALESQFESRDIGFTYVRPVTGQDVIGSALQFDALWLLGGAYPVSDRTHCPWVDDELRLVTVFQKARRPVVGLGFGAHLVAVAAGGEAHAEPLHDAYWTTARATPAGRGDPLADAVDGRRVLVMVNGSVTLPPAVRPLVLDDAGRWIAIRPDALSYGLLFRPELKPGMIEDMVMEEDRPVPEDIGTLIEEARAYWPDTQETTDRIVVALVKALDLMRERRKMPVFALKAVSREE